jgi:hypothetical protein
MRAGKIGQWDGVMGAVRRLAGCWRTVLTGCTCLLAIAALASVSQAERNDGGTAVASVSRQLPTGLRNVPDAPPDHLPAITALPATPEPGNPWSYLLAAEYALSDGILSDSDAVLVVEVASEEHPYYDMRLREMFRSSATLRRDLAGILWPARTRPLALAIVRMLDDPSWLDELSYLADDRAARLTAQHLSRTERTEWTPPAFPANWPGDWTVMVDADACLFYVLNGSELVRAGKVATGSNRRVGRHYFRTPRGTFQVSGKIEDPVWYPPDWNWTERGQTPPRGPRQGQRGVMGKYALHLFEGYFLHVTNKQSSIGTRATHGCVRMLDSDIEYLYLNVPVGTPVIIF